MLCPGLAHECYPAHKPLRYLADALAQVGIAAVRFDLTGTGDSSGRPEDVADVALWTDDIAALVQLLRQGGAPFVAVVGIRGSANLVAASTDHGADATVLWDPESSGRSWLRRATLLHRTVVDDAVGSDGSALGYGYPATLLESLKALRTQSLGLGTPTLVLTRTGESPPGVDLGPAATVGLATAQEQLFEEALDEAKVPHHTIATIVSWLEGHVAERGWASLGADPDEIWRDPAASYLERTGRLGDEDDGLFAVITEPTGEATLTTLPLTCVLLNSGAEWHIGPHRLYVDLARRLAAAGIRALRVDFRGVGDSPSGTGETTHLVYAPWILDDLEVVAGSVDGPVALIGLCSGAYHALEAGARWPVAGVLAVHPGPNFATLATGPTTADARRRVAPAAADRRWLRAAKRHRLGVAAVWRLPGPVWWVLDRLGLQPDLTRAVSVTSARTPEVALLLEHGSKRLWPLAHRRRPPARFAITRADHALWSLPGRKAVLARCHDIAMGWAISASGAPDGPAAAQVAARP